MNLADQLMSAFNQAVRIQPAQDTSDDSYPDTKDDMTTDQPAWATDSLPPAVQSHSGYVWTLDAENGTYWHNWLSPCTPTTLERQYGPCAPLWPDTPPTSIDPADIKVGMRVRAVRCRNDVIETTEGVVAYRNADCISLGGLDFGPSAREWFLVADAPDDDAHWIRAIAEATPETAPTVYAAIKGEQA